VLDQDRLNKSAEEISNVGAELYGEVARFADSMAKIGNRLKSTVNAYNEAIPGLDRFIVAKSRTLKQLGAGKGADAELPEAIEIDPRLFSSRELRASNSLLVKDNAELESDTVVRLDPPVFTREP
jgi:DNA anti-recombination protein RmuC